MIRTIVCFFIIALLAKEAASSKGWPTYGGNSQRSGSTSGTIGNFTGTQRSLDFLTPVGKRLSSFAVGASGQLYFIYAGPTQNVTFMNECWLADWNPKKNGTKPDSIRQFGWASDNASPAYSPCGQITMGDSQLFIAYPDVYMQLKLVSYLIVGDSLAVNATFNTSLGWAPTPPTNWATTFGATLDPLTGDVLYLSTATYTQNSTSCVLNSIATSSGMLVGTSPAINGSSCADATISRDGMTVLWHDASPRAGQVNGTFITTYGLDSATLAIKWQFDVQTEWNTTFQAGVVAAPSLLINPDVAIATYLDSNPNNFFCNAAHYIAFNISTGRKLWDKKCCGALSTPVLPSIDPISTSAFLPFCNSSYDVTGVDLVSGAIKKTYWEWLRLLATATSIVTLDDKVIILYEIEGMSIYNKATGAVESTIGTFCTQGADVGAPVAVDTGNKKIYVQCRSHLQAFDFV